MTSSATCVATASAPRRRAHPNVLLVGNDPGLTGNLQHAINTFDQRRSQADADLQQLTSIGTSDATVQREVGIVLNQLGRYEWAAGQIFLLEQQDASPAGRPAAEVLDLYRQNTDAMRGILTSVQFLSDSNHDLLNNTYLADRSATVAARAWVTVLGVGLVLFLLALQRYFRFRMRRRINPALLLATIATGVLTVAAFAELSDEDGHLTVAKSAAFDSIVVLSQARAVGHDANADESRYLADPGRAAHQLNGWTSFVPALAVLLVGGLTVLGMWPRLAEYR